MLVGYMLVSTDGDRQVMDLQRDALLAAGVEIARQLGWPVSDSKYGRSLRVGKVPWLTRWGKGCVARRVRLLAR